MITLPRFVVPDSGVYSASVPTRSFVGSLLGNTAYTGYVFLAPKAGVIDQVECYLAATGTVNGRLSLQDLDGSGQPDLTEDQYRDLTSVTAGGIVVPGLMTSDGTDTGTKRTVTAGQPLAIVFRQTSTLNSSNFLEFFGIAPASAASSQFGGSGAWYGVQATVTPTWTKIAMMGSIAVKYDDGSYVPLAPMWYPVTVANAHTFNSGSTPDERGARFVAAAALRCCGGWVRANQSGAVDVVLYDSADGVLTSVSLTAVNRLNSSGGSFPFAWAPVTLVAGSTYRVVVKPTSVTSVSVYSFTLSTTNHLACFETGTSWYYTERTDAGAWTDTNTQWPNMGLYFDGIDTPNVVITMPSVP